MLLQIYCILLILIFLWIIFHACVNSKERFSLANVHKENVLQFAQNAQERVFIGASLDADILVIFGLGTGSNRPPSKILCQDTTTATFVRALTATSDVGRTISINVQEHSTNTSLDMDRATYYAWLLTPTDARIGMLKSLRDVAPYDYMEHASIPLLQHTYPWIEFRTLDLRTVFKNTTQYGIYQCVAFHHIYSMNQGVAFDEDVKKLQQKLIQNYGVDLYNFYDIYFPSSTRGAIEYFTDDNNPIKLQWSGNVDVRELQLHKSWYKEATIASLPVPLKPHDVVELSAQASEHLNDTWVVIHVTETDLTLANAYPISSEHFEFVERLGKHQVKVKQRRMLEGLPSKTIYITDKDLVGDLIDATSWTYILTDMASKKQDEYDDTGMCITDPEIPAKDRCKLWDKPCEHDTDCAFYQPRSQGNQGNQGNRGGCMNGYCEMPIGYRRVGFRKYTTVGEEHPPEPFIFPMEDAYRLGLVTQMDTSLRL